jgi:hypothetical protein
MNENTQQRLKSPESPNQLSDEETCRIRITALVCLTVVICTAIICLMFTAIFSDRNLFRSELLTFALSLYLAGLGGATMIDWRRRYRWKVEREDLPNDPR